MGRYWAAGRTMVSGRMTLEWARHEHETKGHEVEEWVRKCKHGYQTVSGIERRMLGKVARAWAKWKSESARVLPLLLLLLLVWDQARLGSRGTTRCRRTVREAQIECEH